MTLIIKSVELPTGVTLQYAEQGNPSGVPMLLLHGLGDSWRSYERVLLHLPDSIHAFALTQRGHGDSSKPEEGYRADDFAADAAAFMEALNLSAAVIVGSSMGGNAARRVAIGHPERTLGLVLTGAFASRPGDPGEQEFLDTTISRLKDPIDPDFMRELQESGVAKPVPQAFFEKVVQESLKVPAHVWKGVAWSDVQDDYLKDLDKIKAPTLIVWGDQDEYCTRSDQEALLAAIPDSRLVVYEGTGHVLHWEEPERFASDLVNFIEELRLAPSTRR